MDSDGSDIDVTELDDCLRELEAIDISDLELSDNEQNLDVEKSAIHEDASEKTESKQLEISKEKSSLPSVEVERKAEFELEGTAKINYANQCTELGENCDIGKSNKTQETKPPVAFQTNLSVTELRQILQTTIEKGILENKNKSEIPVKLSDTTTVVKDSVKLSDETKREETKQLVTTLVQHINHVEPLSSPETTFTPNFLPKSESTPKTKPHKIREEDDSCRIDDTTVKLQVDAIIKQEAPDPVPEDSEVVLSENESPAVLKRSLSQASLSSCETVIFERRSPVFERRSPVFERRSPVFERRSPIFERRSPIFERRSPVDDQRLCLKPSSDIGLRTSLISPSSDAEEGRRSRSDTEEGQRPPSDIVDIGDIGEIEEVILVKSILQNLEALEACDSLEAISTDSMSSPPPTPPRERVDKACTAELSENEIDSKKERRKKRRKKKRSKHRKKKGDNEIDGVSDASSVSSDDFPEHEEKPSRSLDYLAHRFSKKRSPSLKTHDRRSPSSSPARTPSLPPQKQLTSKICLPHSPHRSESLRRKPHDVHYERKLRRDGSSSSSSPSQSRRNNKKLRSAVKKGSAATSRSPTHSPPHRSLHSRYTKKRHESLRSRSKTPKRRYRRRSRSRSLSPHSKKYSITARRRYRKSSRLSESPVRVSPDVRSTSLLERKLSRRLKQLESIKKASRRHSKSRSSSPKIELCSSKERNTGSLRVSKSPKKYSPTITINSSPVKNISECVTVLSSPSSPVTRPSSSPKRRISSSPVAQQSSVCPTSNSQSSSAVGKPETSAVKKPETSPAGKPETSHAEKPKISPLGKPETNSENLPKSSSQSSKSPEEKVEEKVAVEKIDSPKKKELPSTESRTPSPTSTNMKMSNPEPMDISPTPDTKLLKEAIPPLLSADFTKLPPVPSLVMQLPPVWTQPPPPGTIAYSVQQLSPASTALQGQQQQVHSNFGYSHPQVQGTYQNGTPGFGLPVYSQNNNQNSFQQQPLYGQSPRPYIGCQNFSTFPQNTYGSPLTTQDMSVPPPNYNQSQKFQSNLLVQYPPPPGSHTAPYIMQNAQQAQNIMQNSQNIPQSQTQIKINVQQVLHPQNTNIQPLNRTSPIASCRDPRLKDINISVSCETPGPVPPVGTQNMLTSPQMPLPGQPPLPPGLPPPLPSELPPLPSELPPLPSELPPLPPGQPPLPPKETKIEQPPLPKSPPPSSTPPSNKMSKVQANPSTSSTAQPQQLSTNISHLQLNLKKLLPSNGEKKQQLESVTTTLGSEQSDSQSEKPEEQGPEYECVCERTGIEKKMCLRCLYRKRKKLEHASVFKETPNLCRSVKRPIVVNLLPKRKTQPVTAIVKPNVHDIQNSSSSAEQPHQQESVTSAFNSNSVHSETRSHGSTGLVPILEEQSVDILNDRSTVSVQKMSYPGHQTNLLHGDASSSAENSSIIRDVVVDHVSVTHKQSSLVDGSEKIVPESQIQNLETEQPTKKGVKNEHTSEIKETRKDSVVLKQKGIDLNKVNYTSVQKPTLNNRYLTYVITRNKVNKTVLTSVISGPVENKNNSVSRRTYRSKSADSMLDSLNQAAKEYVKLPKDDLLHAVGNSSLIHNTNILENNSPVPMKNAEENKDENNTSVSSSVQQLDQEKTNSTKAPISKYQTSFSEKVEESDTPNSREVKATSAEVKSKESVVKADISNNGGNLDNASSKPNDIHLSEIKMECDSERPAQDIFGSVISVKEEPRESFDSAISVKEEPLESNAGDTEKRSQIIGETYTKLNSSGGVDLGSVCSDEKTKFHETQTPPIQLNSDVIASAKTAECNSSGSAICSNEKVGNTNTQSKSFKNKNSDPSVSMQTERQSLHGDTVCCTQDGRMSTTTDSAPVKSENVFKRPINKDSSYVEGGKIDITAKSDKSVLNILGNVQQPTIPITQNSPQAKHKSGFLDNVAPKVREDMTVAQSLHEKSVCRVDKVMQEKLLKKTPVECEEEKGSRIQRSCLPESASNISVSDSSDSDVIELPPTIDLCLSDDADDVHEVAVSQKVLPIVDATNDKPIVLSDSECITLDSSPKKEIFQTNIESTDVTLSISNAPLIGSQENCESVTDSTLSAEQLDETPCLNSNLCKSSIQRKGKLSLQMKLEVSSADSKQPSCNKRGEVTSTKQDIFKSPPPPKPSITDTLLLQMKPAPRSVKLQHAAILQDKHMYDKICDLNPVGGQNNSTHKIELDRQSAVRDTETKGTPSFSEKKLQNKRNFSVLSDNSNNENTSDVTAVSCADGRGEKNGPPNIQQEYGEPCLKKQKQAPLIKNNEQSEPYQTVSKRDNAKHAQRSTLTVTILQPINIIPSESRIGTLSSQVQRHSARILSSPQKNTVIFAKYMGSTELNSDEEDCSNENITTAQMEKTTNKSEKTIKKYPHRSQLPSYAVSRRILISRLRRCPVVLQANLKKMAKLLRQDSKLTQIPLVILEQTELQSEQNKKIIQNLGLTRSVSRCCGCQVLCRNISTQTDSNHTK